MLSYRYGNHGLNVGGTPDAIFFFFFGALLFAKDSFWLLENTTFSFQHKSILIVEFLS